MMDKKKFLAYEKSLKGSKRFSFWSPPKYTIKFKSNLSTKHFIALANKIFPDFDWEIFYKDEESIEFKRRSPMDTEEWTEKITVKTSSNGMIEVLSQSLTDASYDSGENHKRVQFFQYVMEECTKDYTNEELDSLVEEVKKEDNMADYVIPEKLPKPPLFKNSTISYSIITALLGSSLFAVIFGLMTHFFYILILWESLIGIALGFIIGQSVKWGNYTNFTNLHYLIIGAVVSILFGSQYFQYQLFIVENSMVSIGFIDFVIARLEAGFHFSDFNAGWIGWLIVWVLQFCMIYFISLNRLVSSTIEYQITRIHEKVIEFAMYHFTQDKSEEEVKVELAKMGWRDKQAQEYIMEALIAVYEANQLQRNA